MTRRAILMALAATGALLAAPAAARAAGPSCPSQSANSTPLVGFSSGSRPVILVHGWNGSPSSMRSVAAALSSLPVKPLVFDYARSDTTWASRPAVAACLAEYISTAAAGYRRAGGDGKVIAIGHSMGGAAIRFASSPQYADRPAGSVLGGVITIDTPHLGSPFGNQPTSRALELLTHRSALFPTAVPGSDASICLAPHTPPANRLPQGCAPAPYLPAVVPLTQIAGDITVKRTLFGIPLYSVPLSTDGVVPVPSAHGYLSSGPGGTGPPGAAVDSPTVGCTADFDQMVGGPGTALGNVLSPNIFTDSTALSELQEGRIGTRLLGFLVAAYLAADCSHSGMLKFQPSLEKVVAAVQDDLAMLGSAQSRDGSLVIAGRTSFGGMSTAGTLADAIDVFGQPDALTADDPVGCAAVWRSSGVRATFADYGRTTSTDTPSCEPHSDFAFLEARLTDPRWTTDRGLRIGDPLAKLRSIYPDAAHPADCVTLTVPDKQWWRILRVPDPLGGPGSYLCTVAAIVRQARVAAFDVGSGTSE